MEDVKQFCLYIQMSSWMEDRVISAGLAVVIFIITAIVEFIITKVEKCWKILKVH